MRLLKCWVLGVALSLGAVAVCAGPYEDGLEAWRQGDFSSAAKLVRKAAEQGHAGAQYWLGLAYAEGVGAPKDDQQAVAWYRKAAEQGVASSQYNLGLMYGKGRGVPKESPLQNPCSPHECWRFVVTPSGENSQRHIQ